MNPENTPAIELRGLTKDYAVGLRGVKLRAVDDLTLTIPAGQIFGLLGPNGSGKSTTIKIMLGLIEPTLGGCTVFGVPSQRVEARVDVGYLPESPQFYRHLTGRELVAFYARMGGLAGARLAPRVAEVIGWVGLAEAADRRVGTYSKGMLQRIGLAQALVHDPKLVILDEPTAGVDPLGTAAMTELILQLKAQGKTVLITSHLLAQIETICDRVAIIDRGRLLLEGAVEELVRSTPREAVWLDALPPAERAELRAWLTARGRQPEAVALPGSRLDQIFLERVAAGQAARKH
jgi:ABC-2 type transport system ATP-binding protein